MIKKIYKYIRKIGLRKNIKHVVDLTIFPFMPIYHKIKWYYVSRRRNYSGVTELKYKNELIVSLTSYPKRINSVHLAIESLLMQSMKPNKIILWLAASEFPSKELPKSVLVLKKYGLSIEWCDDLKSYKKLIPALLKYPNAIIMTFDDDLYYPKNVVKNLYNSYITNPLSIPCNRVTKIFVDGNEYKTIRGGYDIYPVDTYLHKLTGCGGVCYPPNSLYKDVTKKDLFMNLAPTNDDIWFWAMAILNGRKCKIIQNYNPFTFDTKAKDIDALSDINNRNERLFWKDFYRIISKYPEIDTILKQEYSKFK